MLYLYTIIQNLISIGGAYLFARLAFEHNSIWCGIAAGFCLLCITVVDKY